MSLAPLFSASWPIVLHACAALFVCILTVVMFSIKRGARLHRILGWVWVCVMGFVALSSFWISDLRQIGPFSLIHLLSIWVLVSLVQNVHAARSHNVNAHRKGMKSLVFGALVVAGLFTFLPGRILFQIATGG